ncbi:involucrin-like [Tachysurus vachellii]|uniref:involucrin-like n=1 Tax=Tachysurus vachellii TaxID=175792 RepID=UPI00296B1FC2|nr:involucrin-like [Tachysurus vachellii]
MFPEQPLKQRLKKKLQMFDDKREEWVFGRKKNHTSGSIKDEAIIMLEKLHAIGYKPVLLLGKENKKKENKCEILTPRCTLSTCAQDYLQRIGPIYEKICDGWTKDIDDDQLITLHLTPCDPLENTSNREVLRTMRVEQTSTTEGEMEQTSTTEGEMEQTSTTEGEMEQTSTTEGRMEQTSTTEGRMEQTSTTEGRMEQTSTTEGRMEQTSTTEGRMEQTSTTEGRLEQTSTTEGRMEQMSTTEGRLEQTSTTEGRMEQTSTSEGQAVFTGSARGTVTSPKKKKSGGLRHMPERKKPQKRQSRNVG